MYKAIIFDMDGVIIDSEPLWEKSEKILLNSFGLSYNPVYRDKILGLNQNDSANLLRDTFNLDKTLDEIIDERLKILLRLYKDELKLINGIENLIIDSHDYKLKVGLASSSPMKIINFVLNKFGLNKYFDAVISGECTENGKPHPDIYLEASKQLEVTPSECIAVEDSINGTISAKNAGMYCIAVPDPRLNIKDYQKADLIVKSLTAIKIAELI
ncbi:MAG: HAD family hydrolase [Thermodesulfobacteriota bacterium]